MRRYFFCCAAIVLSACASSPIQKMSLKDAVNFGTDQYYNTPNYAFQSSTKIDSFDMGILGKADEVALAGRLFKRMSFDMSGVVDTPNKQYQIIPTYQYKAKNLQAALSVPMVYDGKQQHFLVDVSAFDALLGSGDNEGKYSRFDVSEFNINDKGEKILRIIQKYTRNNYADMQNAAFVELPLNADDKRMNAVRKIQVTTDLKNDAFDTAGMMKEMFAAIKPADKDIATDGFTQEVAKGEAQAKELIDPSSKQVNELSFDKDGRIVQARALIDMALKKNPSDAAVLHIRARTEKPKTDDSPATRITATTTISMSDIGRAQLVNPPTADNTVDGIENFKSGLLGKKLADIFKPTKSE